MLCQETIILAASITPLSVGKFGRIPVILEAGTYIVVCFVPDIEVW
jgi:hypothetical protein